jgi:uncharacterized integral membrane protein (TIGR00697 family)
MEKPESFRYLDVVSAFFAMILVVSNLSSSAKIVDLGASIFGVPLAFDGGTLLFPLSYVFGDILAEIYGFRASRRVIWTGFICLAFSSLLIMMLSKLPSEENWARDVGQGAFDAILGGMSSGGLVIASLAGYLAGEFSNSFVLVKIKAAMKGRLLFVRTIGSTLIGELIDSFIFVSVASLAGVFGWEIFASLVLTNYFFKCAVEIIMTPATYGAVALLRKKEGVATTS